MNPTTRTIRPTAVVALYAALALAWAGFAGWVVAPRVTAAHPGPLVEALKRFLEVPPAGFLRQDMPGRWREFSGAVTIAMALHLIVVALLMRSRRRAAGPGSSPRLDLVLGTLAAAFLAVAAVSPARQDYYFYLEIWYHIQRGHDPWFTVLTVNGTAPLNAYGPLFNPLAYLAWINPVAPRLLLSQAYVLFAIAMSRGFAAGRPPSGLRTFGLLVLFWSPFAWIEVAFYGHLDILVGLACLGSVRAWADGRDIRAGLDLAAGVLLKFLPIVLLPFLAIDPDRPRLRSRFLATALAAIAAVVGASVLIWGPSTFLPMALAANRRPEALSIFQFLRGRYSPLLIRGTSAYTWHASPILQVLGLAGVWQWSRSRRPDVVASALAAVLVLVLLYRVGYPQYQMVPFVLASAWVLRDWDRLRSRTALVVAMALYFGWIAAYDVGYFLHEVHYLTIEWMKVEDAAGLPTFLLGAPFLACVFRAATPAHSGGLQRRPQASGMMERSAQPAMTRVRLRSEEPS